MASPSTTSRSQTQPTSTTQTKPTRLPAPTLFVGPPSRNASQLSITRTTTHTSIIPPQPTTTTTSPPPPRLPGINIHSETQVEEKWKKIQATLNEVELVAQSSTHVFGQEHAGRLDGLRMAQIELARAWGRNITPTTTAASTTAGTGTGMDREEGGGRKEEIGGAPAPSMVSTALEGEDSEGEVFEDAEEETAADIRLARERRAANEAYFKRVDERVRDVVLKLEGVAEAMRSVEAESRSLWSSEESLGVRKGGEV